jgi:hypothetical protein
MIISSFNFGTNYREDRLPNIDKTHIYLNSNKISNAMYECKTSIRLFHRSFQCFRQEVRLIEDNSLSNTLSLKLQNPQKFP